MFVQFISDIFKLSEPPENNYACKWSVEFSVENVADEDNEDEEVHIQNCHDDERRARQERKE